MKKISIGSPKKEPVASVVLCVYNEENYLDDSLLSLKEQSFTDFEVVVVDDGSTDKTLDVANKYDVRIVQQKHDGLGAARNNGVKNAKGKIVLFLDADMTFDKNYIKQLIKPIQENKTSGTTHGKEHANNLQNPWARCWGRVRIDPSISTRTPKNYRAIKRSAFLKSKGFDSSWGYADDQSLTAQVGPALIVNDAQCYHQNPSSLQETYLQARWIGGSTNKKYVKLLLTLFSIGIIFGITSWIMGLAATAVRYGLILSGIMFIVFVIFMTQKTIRREKDWGLLFIYPGFLCVRVIATLHGILRQLGKKSHLQ